MPHQYSRRHRHHSSSPDRKHQTRITHHAPMIMIFLDNPFSVLGDSSSITKTTLIFSKGRSHNGVLSEIHWDLRERRDGCGVDGSPSGFRTHEKTCSVLTFNGKIATDKSGGLLRLLFEKDHIVTILTVKELESGHLDFSIPHVSDKGGVYRLQLEVPTNCRVTIEPGTTFGILTMPCKIDEGEFT